MQPFGATNPIVSGHTIFNLLLDLNRAVHDSLPTIPHRSLT
jgi:hypothetical protein